MTELEIKTYSIGESQLQPVGTELEDFADELPPEGIEVVYEVRIGVAGSPEKQAVSRKKFVSALRQLIAERGDLMTFISIDPED